MFTYVSFSIGLDQLFETVIGSVEYSTSSHSTPIHLSTVSIKCGIFQGDTLSPLLFCLALNPLSYLLDQLDGYKVSYMDDLKKTIWPK